MDEQNSQNNNVQPTTNPEEVVPSGSPQVILASSTTQTKVQAYQGPLPTPEMLEAFGKIDPELPKLIVNMAAESNRAMVNKADAEAEKTRAEADRLRSEIRFTGRGQWMVLGIFMAFPGAALALAFNGHDLAASACFGALAAVGILMGIQKRSGKQN